MNFKTQMIEHYTKPHLFMNCILLSQNRTKSLHHFPQNLHIRELFILSPIKIKKIRFFLIDKTDSTSTSLEINVQY